jgi:hypothetical protein
MNGKDKCNRLRELRRLICIQNGIPFTEEECTSSGDGCRGTCPKCDQALRLIAMRLAERKKAGLPVVLDDARKAYHSSLRQ